MKYLSDYTQKAQTALFAKTGAFFAFSKEQFDEAKEDGVIYVSLFAGLIVPENNAKALIEQLKKIKADGIAQDINENGKSAIIQRELSNFECFYTGDISDCVDTLVKYGITEEEVRAEFQTRER